MPTYLHICTDENCSHEWEDEYSIKDEPPKVCPKCGKETAKRTIYGGSGRGIVEYTGSELVDKLRKEGSQMKKDIYSSENKYANFIGEERYQNIQSQMDKRRR